MPRHYPLHKHCSQVKRDEDRKLPLKYSGQAKEYSICYIFAIQVILKHYDEEVPVIT